MKDANKSWARCADAEGGVLSGAWKLRVNIAGWDLRDKLHEEDARGGCVRALVRSLFISSQLSSTRRVLDRGSEAGFQRDSA